VRKHKGFSFKSAKGWITQYDEKRKRFDCGDALRKKSRVQGRNVYAKRAGGRSAEHGRRKGGEIRIKRTGRRTPSRNKKQTTWD